MPQSLPRHKNSPHCFLKIRIFPVSNPFAHGEVPSAGKSDAKSSSETDPPCRRSLACSACVGASFCPQSGQFSKPAATPPTSRVIPSRCTVTSVRTVRVVPGVGVPERKKLARLLNHWYSRFIRPPLTGSRLLRQSLQKGQ